MGAAWCRERIELAQNSKSPIDRIITRCSNAINSKTLYSKPNQSKPANDIVFKQIRFPTAPIVPVHRVPPPRSHRSVQKQGECVNIPLNDPGYPQLEKTPVPPPRRRKRRKVNSLAVLNSQLDKIYESRNELRCFGVSQNLFFGDPLPVDTQSSNNSSPERRSPAQEVEERRRKSRARKIMDNKTKFIKKESQKLSVARVGDNFSTKLNQTLPPKMIKNVSSVSLPSYEELARNAEDTSETTGKTKTEKRTVSTVSLPGESVLTSISGVTMNRLEAYMRRCKSFGSLKPHQLLEKLEEITNKQETESSDSWSGLDEWDLGIIEYCDAEPGPLEPPLVPKCRLSSKRGRRVFDLNSSEQLEVSEQELPPTPPPVRRDLSLSDSTLDKPQSTFGWSSTPDVTVVIRVSTPPPTPEEKPLEVSETLPDQEQLDAYPTTNLFKVLSSYSLASDMGPTPPRRRSREDILRRQSYQGEDSYVRRRILPRSMSLDPTKEELSPALFDKAWRNMSFSSSRHSIVEAISDFLGYDTGSRVPSLTPSEAEINLNSSLLPVIGPDVGDKASLPEAPLERVEGDRKTPSPPPLPSSPPPIAQLPSTDLSPI